MNLKSFDLNLLRVLDALLTEGSTVKAGERIGLSQPAVSAALGRLRQALGDPLFVRQGQGLRPTDVALALEGPLREALDSLQTILTGPLQFDLATGQRDFRLSGTDFFAVLLMPQLANHLCQVAPGIRAQLIDLFPNSYVRPLEQLEVDIALIPQAAFPEWVEHAPLFDETFTVIARQDHPRIVGAHLAAGDIFPLDLLCELEHILCSPDGQFKGMGDAALSALGRKRRVVMTLPVFSGVCNAVADSDLIALVPARLANHLAPKLGFACYLPPMPVGPVRLCMAWHKRSTTDPAHRWLRDQIAELLSPHKDMSDQLG